MVQSEKEDESPILSIKANDSQLLVFTGFAGALITSTAFFILGFDYRDIGNNIAEWLTYSFVAQLLFSLTSFEIRRRINKGSFQRTGFNQLPISFLIIFKPFFNSFIKIVFLNQNNNLANYSYTLYYVNVFLNLLVIAILVLFYLRILANNPIEFINRYFRGVSNSDLKDKITLQSKSFNEEEVKNNIYQSSAEPKELLGKGTSIFDSVIKSMLFRANSAQRNTQLSMLGILFLVFVGGGASIGTVALDEVNKIRDLEIQRKKLLSFINVLDGAVAKNNDSLLLKAYVGRINNFIKIQYNEGDSYKVAIEKIQQQSNTSWPDIAMRVAIAALTLFLVQILFNVYKYNQQQSFYLHTKAEILELYKETEADKKDLRTGLLSKLDSGPAFGQGPNSPAEQVINIIDKAKGGS